MLRLEEANTPYPLLFSSSRLPSPQPFSTKMVAPSLNTNIKFLCSYGGRILPRYPDGKLRYHGGHTRVLAVDRSISFSELLVKLGELCGFPVCLRCQLPMEDLDALVSVTSDEDLVNLVEEYDRTATTKIRAFLSLPKKPSPTPSAIYRSSSSTSTATLEAMSPKSPPSPVPYSASRFPVVATSRCVHQMYSKSPVKKFPLHDNKSAGKLPYHAYGSSGRSYLVHN